MTSAEETVKVAGLLTLAMASASQASMHLADVVDLCGEYGEPLEVKDALALLGMVTAAKYEAENVLEAADRAAAALLTQYHVAEQELEQHG